MIRHWPPPSSASARPARAALLTRTVAAAAAQGYFPPECDVVSIFLDQCDGQFNMTEAEAIASLGKDDDEYAAFTAASASQSQDNGVAIATAAGIPVCASIKQALQIGDGGKLNVDGVVLIGEHGDYPADEFGRHMYPRKHLFEQIAGVFAASGRSVPVFNDKHFSYNMEDGAQPTCIPFVPSVHSGRSGRCVLTFYAVDFVVLCAFAFIAVGRQGCGCGIVQR
jgi:hypothetical protein